jgi:hypothetical protein
MTLSKITLSLTMLCGYAAWRIIFIAMLNVIMVSVIMLSVVAPGPGVCLMVRQYLITQQLTA